MFESAAGRPVNKYVLEGKCRHLLCGVALAVAAFFALVSTEASATGTIDLRSMPLGQGGQLAPIVAGDASCDASTPGIIIHDDGTAENGYSFNPGVVTEGRLVDRFTPSSYPATFSSVCFAWVANDPNITSNAFDIVVYAADGVGGAPGTLLASKPVVGLVSNISGVPFVPVFQSFDISDLVLNIAAGDVYIGARWNPEAEQFAFIGADESDATPLAGGYIWADGNGQIQSDKEWILMGVDFESDPNYHALDIRAVAGPAAAPTVTLSQSFSPPTILDSRTSALTFTLTNQTNTLATLQSAILDLFPDGLLTAEDIGADSAQETTCGNGVVLAGQGNGFVRLSSGATIPANSSCSVTIKVSAPAGHYDNTLDAGVLSTDVGTYNFPASASLDVSASTGIFPAPYCQASFPDGVEPISKVTGAGIDNSSDPTLNGSPASEDFTSVMGTVSLGQSYPFAIEGNTDGIDNEFVEIYVDWNRNGLFSDGGEFNTCAFLHISTGTDGVQCTFNMKVPADALLGPTRMRIVKSTGSLDSCTNAGAGQAEDYTIMVVDEVFRNGFE